MLCIFFVHFVLTLHMYKMHLDRELSHYSALYIAYVIVKYLKSCRTSKKERQRATSKGMMLKALLLYNRQFFSLFPRPPCSSFLFSLLSHFIDFTFFSHAVDVTVIIRSLCSFCCCQYNLYCVVLLYRSGNVYFIIYFC